ncbi:MAG: glycerol kinase [Firmicutes bacterium HGW-Firmicutes-1]|jgi:glycerol kinase|nr:MAG: glycerol kinase [Firmicutes bacterium HGW-Firmicutes-1]
MAFDCGTTGVRTILFDKSGNISSMAYEDFEQIYPKPGWVEHDPIEIWNAQLSTVENALKNIGASINDVEAIGITNQRETTVVWNKKTGKPVMNAIVWQDRRTTGICEELKEMKLDEYVKKNTGLLIDAYFSGTKIKWILDHVEGVREKAELGDVIFGTIDTWITWKLTGGSTHVTDYSNASRTLLFNINTLEWDEKMLSALDIPKSMLPQVKSSSEVYSMTNKESFFNASIPVAALIGDQQSALFGQTCFEAGMTKATYGTGGSLVMNTGSEPIESKSGLLTTIAWGIDKKIDYALEGLLYTVGSSVQWLRDEMQLIDNAKDSEICARKVKDTNGVYVVPAFTGLSAPYWDQYARGAILGLTRGANKNHIIRATLESIAYQIRDVIDSMEKDSGIPTVELKVDGGACVNDFLMEFQADILNVTVIRPKIIESTARGAAFLAGLATGFWKDKNDLICSFELDKKFEPNLDEEGREVLYAGWKRAVDRTTNWIEH